MIRVLIAAILLVSGAGLTQAQLFSRESLGGAAVGGLIGGIIGHNSGGRTAEGVGIGAGAGLLLGALAHQSRPHYHYQDPYYSHDPIFAPPSPRYSPRYPAYYTRPNYAIGGAALGGLAGGIIGHNSGRRTAEGIAIGAGAGLLLASIAEHETRRFEREHLFQRPVVYNPPAPRVVRRPPESQPQPATINNFQSQSSSSIKTQSSNSGIASANRLFGR